METLLKILKKFSARSKVRKNPLVSRIAIFGFADAKPSSKLYQDAFKVSAALAAAGFTIVDGGGPGVMEAASRGAKAGGGEVIGVTFYPKDAAHFEGRDVDNPIDREIKTKNYIERTLSLMREGQIYVVFNGASGTMSEFAMAWGLARLYFGHHKPLILYGKFWRPIMKALRKNLMVRPEETKVYKIVDSPEQVLKAIEEFEEEMNTGRHRHLKINKDESFAIQ